MQVNESGNLIIARILGGSTAARQGLLRTGEVILEVNGKEVHNPEELQEAIHEAKENLSLKLAPGIATDGNRPVKSTVIFDVHKLIRGFYYFLNEFEFKIANVFENICVV